MTWLGYVALGLAAGLLSGLIGIGGGVLIVPALVYFFNHGQHEAQGTTLAMLVPPVGLLAAWTYYKRGHVQFPVAGLLCLGFVVGAFVGARYSVNLPRPVLRKIFGVAMLGIALDMILRS